jgi:hypothetical protein
LSIVIFRHDFVRVVHSCDVVGIVMVIRVIFPWVIVVGVIVVVWGWNVVAVVVIIVVVVKIGDDFTEAIRENKRYIGGRRGVRERVPGQ